MKLEKYDKKFVQEQVKDYVIIGFWLAVYCFSLVGFVIKSKIVGGGVNGVGTLIYYATGQFVSVGTSALIINIFLLFLGFKILGTGFGVKTVYAIVLMSVYIDFFQSLLPGPLLGEGEQLLSAIIGGLLIGTSVGFVFNRGGSSGGTDIIALIITKYKNISPGKVILYADLIIISSAFFVFYFALNQNPTDAFRTVVYGFVEMGIVSYGVDLIVLGAQQSVQVFVFSQKHDEIAEMISKEVKRGVTVLRAKGWYSQQDSDVLMVVMRKNQLQETMRKIKQIDPKAFTSITAATGVYGQGFEQIK